MKWIVTGGCGFIGSNLADLLLRSGWEVAILDNLSRMGALENLRWLRQRHGAGWRFIEADIRNRAAVESIVTSFQPDSIAHLAGQVAMTSSLIDPRADFEINVLGTINVLEAVRSLSPQSIVIYSSSNKVYGELAPLRYRETESRYELVDVPNGIDESFPIDGCSPYGCSKLAADQYVRDYHRMYGLRTVVFRHSSVYGSRQFATFDQGWVGWFCKKGLEISQGSSEALSISGDGKQVRDILDVQDAAAAYVSAAVHIDRSKGQIFNIGGGPANSLSLRELFTYLEKRLHCAISFTGSRWRKGDQKVFVSDTLAAKIAFGWQATLAADSGLNQMLDWANTLA